MLILFKIKLRDYTIITFNVKLLGKGTLLKADKELTSQNRADIYKCKSIENFGDYYFSHKLKACKLVLGFL